MRLEVAIQDETVWLTQAQIADLFGTKRPAITKHLSNIYREGELDEKDTCSILEHMGNTDKQKYRTKYYNLDAILSVGYRVNSRNATLFRRWATGVLRDYLLRGYSINARLNRLENKMDRRFAKHEGDIADLKDKVDFFVRTNIPPVQGVFYEGQVFDARVFVTKHILSAKKSILLIDNWVDMGTLDILAKKGKNVSIELVSSSHGNKLMPTDIAKFNAQYGGLTVKTSKSFHDRFLIVDDCFLYLIGASLKDLGTRCFAFTQLDAREIPNIKTRV